MKYSRANLKTSEFTRPPKNVNSSSRNAKYIIAVKIPALNDNNAALPTVSAAFLLFFAPKLMLTNAQTPSPINNVNANAITVNGKTTLFAAFPFEPK